MKKNIILTYMPSDVEKERICGHTFEVMDYFLLLYDNGIKSTILIQENISKEKIFQAWEDKYILPNDYKKYIIFSRSKIIQSDIIIFTGGIEKKYYNKKIIKCKNLIIFRCNPFIEYTFINKHNFQILEDIRIYKNYKIFSNSTHYIKKIYFKRYKKLNQDIPNKILIYINDNLRKIPLSKFNNYLIVSGNLVNKKTKPIIHQAPMLNLFNKFDTFLYTPTTRKFDCSPRLITECFFYNKKILFNFDIDKYAKDNKDSDSGLYWRWFDIQNNFKSLCLTDEDYILKIINLQRDKNEKN